MIKQIQLGIEKMNRGHWLRVTIPYTTTEQMIATLQSKNGQLLKTVKLITGNNLIDVETISHQSVHIRIDTPYETVLKELYLE